MPYRPTWFSYSVIMNLLYKFVRNRILFYSLNYFGMQPTQNEVRNIIVYMFSFSSDDYCLTIYSKISLDDTDQATGQGLLLQIVEVNFVLSQPRFAQLKFQKSQVRQVSLQADNCSIDQFSFEMVYRNSLKQAIKLTQIIQNRLQA